MLSARLRRSWRALSSGVFVLLPLVWYTHVVLTKLGDPLGLPVDGFLWGTATVLKIVAWVALFQALRSVHARLFDSGPRALRACLIWATAAIQRMRSLQCAGGGPGGHRVPHRAAVVPVGVD